MNRIDKYQKEHNDDLAYPSSVLIKISKWKDFLRLSYLLSGGQWIFRGQEDASWSLKSSLERDNAEYQKEKKLTTHKLFRFMLEDLATTPRDEYMALEEFKKLSHLIFDEGLIAYLASMQHFGAKTRLVDFTFSIFIALFFAFEERGANYDRAIFAVKYGRIIDNSKLLKNEFEKYLKTCSKKKWNEDWLAEAWEDFYIENIENRYNLIHKCIDLANKMLHNNQEDYNCHENGVIPIQLIGNNTRITSQNGLFLFPINFNPFVENLASSISITSDEINNPSFKIGNLETIDYRHAIQRAYLVKIVFDKKISDGAWRILEQANISARSVYPDITGIAKSIRY